VTVSTFGLTAAILRADYLPQADDFSTSSSPTTATVTRLLNQKAAELEGKLQKEAISPSGITSATSAPYLWCQETLGLMVMIRVAGLMRGTNSELVKEWQVRLDDRLASLEEDGGTALGDPTLSSSASDPDGPTSHVTELSLDTSTMATDASTLAPKFRKDDVL
jgi:hypothetical protein